MKKILHFVVLFLTISTFSAKSQISITNISTPYSQNFDALANTGATNDVSTLPTGWTFLETGTNKNTTYAADAGTTAGGNTFSYGATASTERALGTLRSGSLVSTIGASFTNNSGSVITSLEITFTGEQWRLGATGRSDTLNFQYSTNATDLVTGTWVDENNLDFLSPIQSGTAGQLDGNLTANRTNLSFTITGISIANGSSFWLRWLDADATGADDGLAIDDFNVNFNGTSLPTCVEPTNQPTALVLTPTPETVSGTFTASSPSVDQYLVIRSTSASLSASPVDGTTYTLGQSFGGGSVISIGTANNFVDAGLTANTPYYYFVYALNSEDCVGGPNYLITSPLTNNRTTSPLPTCSTSVASATVLNLTPSNNTILGSFSPVVSSVNYRYLIVRSTSSSLSSNPANGTVYSAGQTLGNGIVVDYISGTSFVATGLTVATKYYFYIFTVSAECNGEPFYKTTAPLTGNTTTTNSVTNIPAGYYSSAQQGQTCGALKTALKNIISANTTQLTYTPGVWNAIKRTDIHRNDANTADIIWDIYTDNPTGAEVYTFAPGTNQCGSYSKEGDCYNREHSFPQEWFGSGEYPMYSDLHHIFPTDGWVNAKHDHNPYGEVANPTFTSISNKTKSGPNSFGCYSGTVLEPIDAYKGDIARAQLYMITRYEDSMIAWQSHGDANTVLNGTKYPSLDDWYIQLLLKWHHQDPVSQKEINRNDSIYLIQGNRNPFIDIPSFADDLFTCVTLQCIVPVPVKLIDFAAAKNTKGISVNWSANNEISFKNYEVERSIDGINFSTIGTVTAKNISQYSFDDNVLPNTDIIVYYRLKMVDIDGKSTYSRVVSVRIESPIVSTTIFPNPANSNITVKLSQNLKAKSILKITDIVGRVVLQQNVASSQNSIPLNIAHLASGKYFITIKNDTEFIQQSFIKVK